MKRKEVTGTVAEQSKTEKLWEGLTPEGRQREFGFTGTLLPFLRWSDLDNLEKAIVENAWRVCHDYGDGRLDV